MTVLARDLSNYSKMPLALDEWKAAGVGLVLIQSVNPPAGYPKTQTVAQIDACLAAGLAVDVYVWWWADLDTADIAAKLALLSGYTASQIRQVWLDVEDVAAAKYDQVTTEAKISAALALCDAFPTSSGSKAGIYSGHWYWADPRYCNNTTAFSDRKLWTSEYDHIADPTVFTRYGGWATCALKQYEGSQPDGTDLNVVSDAELNPATPIPLDPVSMPPDRETPADFPFPDWRQSAIAYRGALDGLVPERDKLAAEVTALQAQIAAEPTLAAQLAQTQKDRDAAVATQNLLSGKIAKAITDLK